MELNLEKERERLAHFQECVDRAEDFETKGRMMLLLGLQSDLVSALEQLVMVNLERNSYQKVATDAEALVEQARVDVKAANQRLNEMSESYYANLAELEQAREALRNIKQRCNESGTGEMGLIDTIHAVCRYAAAGEIR